MMINLSEQEISEKPQSGDLVLSVKGVSKKFCRDLKRSLFYGVQDIASELVGTRDNNEELRSKEFWALNNVSFDLRRGEALGLVGANGSGKTTLLRIISGLIRPDTGLVEVKGRLAPLIASGAGFNPILTGRENIHTNMSILGLSKQEINERFQDVLDFAEIGDAIDAPVQSYSSGMAARLGFASAIHTEPDILLIDEVLAVGDIKFRAKCHRKLADLLQKGSSFILVSHQAHAILNVCNSAVYLSQGKVIASGNTSLIITQYEEDLFAKEAPKSSEIMFIPEKTRSESYGLDIISVFFRDEQENIVESPIVGDKSAFCVRCKAHTIFDNICIHLAIQEIAGESGYILELNSFYDNKLFFIYPGKHEIRVNLPYLGLKYGSYTMKVFVKKGALNTLDVIESFRFTVKEKEGNLNRGLFYQPREWEVISDHQ